MMALHSPRRALQNDTKSGHGGWTGLTGSTGRRLVAALSLVIVVIGTSGCNWWQFRYSFAQSGYNNTENAISVGNVGSLVRVFSARAGSNADSSPAIANGLVYEGADDGMLYAFDATGKTNCLGSPKTCAPLWYAPSGGFRYSSAAVSSNGIVYEGSVDGTLYAYDAAGNTNCSGTPKLCNPLWTASTGGGIESSPTVNNGIVYVGSGDGNLYAFDAAGITNCSGTPKTCAPLWVAHTPSIVVSSPAVVNGVVYVGSLDHNLYAFDAAGVTNCSGGGSWPASSRRWGRALRAGRSRSGAQDDRCDVRGQRVSTPRCGPRSDGGSTPAPRLDRPDAPR